MKLAVTRDGQTLLIEDDVARKLPGAPLEYLSGRPLDPIGEEQASDPRTFAPPVPRPGKVIGIGLNYEDHARKLGRELPPAPLMFLKASTCIAGNGDPIVIPCADAQVDYEAELAVVIGTRVKDVSVEKASTAIGGFMCFNDVSDRTAQWGDGQWMRGKSADTFGPSGPVIVTPDEIDAMSLAISAEVNGQQRQSSNTSNMIFNIYELVSYCSKAFTLEPGDLISTGTPAGVAAETGDFLKAGDVVTVEIEGLGKLSNPVTI